MERRYGRANERYRAKINKADKKAPLGVIMARQSAVCAVLLAVGAASSFFNTGSRLHSQITSVLYETNSLSDWKRDFYPAFRAVQNGAAETVNMYNRAIKLCESKLGINKPSDGAAPVKANAEKKEKKQEAAPKKEEAAEEKNEMQTAEENSAPVFCIPTEGEITSVFGGREHPISGEIAAHTGIDIAAPSGQTVVSAAEGTVSSTGSDSANGNYVTVNHGGSFTTVYAHLSAISVKDGQRVDGSTKIGEVGSSGISTGPHLHFEIKINQKSVNPEDYITLPHREGI